MLVKTLISQQILSLAMEFNFQYLRIKIMHQTKKSSNILQTISSNPTFWDKSFRRIIFKSLKYYKNQQKSTKNQDKNLSYVIQTFKKAKISKNY